MFKKVNELSGFEDIRDIYWVGSNSHVYSFGNYGSSQKANKPRKLKTIVKPNGYANVALMRNDGTVATIRLHRLVATAFVPNPHNLPVVNHLDEIKHHNHADNLEWVTHKGNNDYSLAKKVFQYDGDGTLVRTYNSVADVGAVGFNKGHVAACARGEESHHKGFVFSFKFMTKHEVVQRLSKPFYLKGDRRRK